MVALSDVALKEWAVICHELAAGRQILLLRKGGILEPLRRLDGQHGLAWQAVERRFWYRRPGLHVLVLRIHRLALRIGLPNLSRYDGCHSWVWLESAVPTLATLFLPQARSTSAEPHPVLVGYAEAVSA